VQSRHELRLFHVWSYAHLPLYLGIGVAGIGAEHVIRFAPSGHLHAAESWMLAAGLAAAMGAITTIAASRPHTPMPPLALVRQYGTAAVTLLLGAVGAHIPPAPFLLSLVALAIAQLVMTLRASGPTSLTEREAVEAAV
jgi:low temperature requirement protein LtrA